MRKLWGAFVVIALVGAMVGISAGVAHASPPPVTFAPKTDFATGDEPLSVAVADLNGDRVAGHGGRRRRHGLRLGRARRRVGWVRTDIGFRHRRVASLGHGRRPEP